MKNLADIEGNYAVVNVQDGYLGYPENLVLIKLPDNEAECDAIIEDEEAAAEYAEKHGQALFYDDTENN